MNVECVVPVLSLVGMSVVTREQLSATVARAIAQQPIIDIHTHLYPPSFGTTLAGAGGRADPRGLLLWGVDELITYHYLVAEVFRVVPHSVLPYEAFWKMSKSEQADHIWKHLFVERSPVSEACRGVLTTIQRLGLDPGDRDLNKWRRHFSTIHPDKHVDRAMELANVTSLTMTNFVFDENERQRWMADAGVGSDARFKAVLRIDPMLRAWPSAAASLKDWGYATSPEINDHTLEEAKRFLRDWLKRQNAIYMAASLPPSWRYPVANEAGTTILEKVVLPVAEEFGIPMAMMIGSEGPVNPSLNDAGYMVGKSDIASLVRLCAAFPKTKFLVTMLARENQHELCVAARKFGNLMIFGCWWFVNNPSLIDEITRMRLELLGTSFIPQHSDARVLEQIIYKWDHSKSLIAAALTDKYADLLDTGWRLTEEEIRRDVRHLLHDNFVEFLK